MPFSVRESFSKQIDRTEKRISNVTTRASFRFRFSLWLIILNVFVEL
jgi:hypothetical protein